MAKKETPIRYPSQVTRHVSFFDKMADAIHRFVSSAVFFVVGFLLVILSFGAAGVARFSEVWLWTIALVLAAVTFLMVAVLENAARRSELALHHKLNAQSRALLALLGAKGDATARRELLESIGVEERESASGIKE